MLLRVENKHAYIVVPDLKKKKKSGVV